MPAAMTDPLILRGLAMTAVIALWFVVRIIVRRAILRRNEARSMPVAPALRPLVWRPWIAGACLVIVTVVLATVASRRHGRIRDLHLPAAWHLEQSRFWTDWLAAGGIGLGFRVEGDHAEVEREVEDWLASRGPWDASADTTDRDLRAGAMPLEPTFRQLVSDEASWRRDLLLDETRPFRVFFRRRGNLHDYVEGVTLRVIETGPRETWIDAWVYDEVDL